MLCLLVGVPLLFAAGAQDQDELRGTWLVKSCTANGDSIYLPARAKFVLIFGDDKEFIMRRVGMPDRVGKFTTGPGLLTKDINIARVGQDDETSIGGLGIFKVEDNCLLLAIGAEQINGKGVRPTDFDGKKSASVASSSCTGIGVAPW